MFVRLQPEPFDAGAELNAFLESHPNTGAHVSFTGTVRSTASQPVQSLTLEHYPELAQKQLTHFGAQAIQRFNLNDIGIIHRFGTMMPDEVIVMVIASAPHRQAAFDGANFVMDWLKTDAPFWKSEIGPDGQKWVQARHEDNAARNKWAD